MPKVRTTLRIDQKLKKEVEKKALDMGINFQEFFNRALYEYLEKQAEKKAKKIVFKSWDFGVPLDNLTRDDIYGEPKL